MEQQFSPQTTRKPAVAGMFYPAEVDQLTSMVDQMFQQAKPTDLPKVKAIIAPHAGFVYSGPIAATAYSAIKAQADEIKRVVLLGPSHRVGFKGIATCSAAAYETPMGAVALDREATQQIADLPQVHQLDHAHVSEHSLEVQLPFLQTLLDDFKLIPLVVSDTSIQEVSEVIERLWGGDDTLIVISSDLSHYNDYVTAQAMDSRTSDAIVNFEPEKLQYEYACGRNPVKGLLQAAQKHHLKSKLLDLRNSGDTAGSKDKVVGYGAYAFYGE